jgi:hypothetical protein
MIKRARRLGIAGLVLALFVGGAASLAGRARPETPPEGAWIPVRAQPLENRLGLAGRIEAATRLTVTAPFEGALLHLAVSEGGLAEPIMQRARISPRPTPPILPLSGEGRKRSPWRVRVGGLIGLFLKQLLSRGLASVAWIKVEGIPPKARGRAIALS